ncbi:STAS domain-containing protein [Streptomyces sp. NPDC127119]|uniref:STAS domain-containing protein n=1 Tax=Streptomyces sp. NPDC127119 TaxID=3345370 RepID=UPI00363EF95D
MERSRDCGTWAVLTLSGEMDLATVPLLREAVDELVVAGRAHLVWNLQAVSFMDSSGLGVLVYAMRSTEAVKGCVRLAGAGQQIRQLLELTGLDTVIEQYPDVPSATGPVTA